MNTQELKTVHRECYRNRTRIATAEKCSCFYCLREFNPESITNWVDRNGTTALCPFCGIDSVLCDVSTELVKEVSNYAFGEQEH